jgi:hypothetical protein
VTNPVDILRDRREVVPIVAAYCGEHRGKGGVSKGMMRVDEKDTMHPPPGARGAQVSIMWMPESITN